MARILNEIIIDAPVERVWRVLASIEELDRYDPGVKRSVSTSDAKSGIGASRRVEMNDGKNWFEETTIEYAINHTLTFALTECSFPIEKLTHRYCLQTVGERTKVCQEMNYTVKFGPIGLLLDVMVIRAQSDKGVKVFFVGLKSHVERNSD